MTAAPGPSTRVSGRPLRLARLAWWVLAIGYLAFFVATLPGVIFAPPTVTPLVATWSAADMRQAFAAAGLSVDGYALLNQWINLGLRLAYVALGLFIFWRRSDDWMALLLSFFFLAFVSTDNFVAAFGPSPLMATLDEVNAATISALTFPLLLIFPDGHFVPRWTRWAAVWAIAVQVWRLFFPGLYDAWGLPLALPPFAVAPLAQVLRYRRTDPIQRQQIKWIVAGLVATIGPLVLTGVVLGLVPALSRPSGAAVIANLAGSFFWSLFVIAFPLTLTIAILRYRLFDIDLIIRRTLVYTALTAVLALAYFGSVLVLQNIFQALTGQGQNTIATVLSTLIIAALFVPVRGRVQRVIDRRFFRQKYDAARTLAAFGAQARDVVALEQLSSELVSAVDQTMQPTHVGLWVKPEAERPVTASRPRA